MQANAVSLLDVFEKKMRLEVPLFQRQYVWGKEQQWEPLWDDIATKFSDYLQGRRDSPVHFLGAIVLDQKQTPTTYVDKRQIIDGQQRLTSLQVFLSAYRDFCKEQGCDDLARECEGFTLNKGMMVEPDKEKFKVWPTQLDRPQFSDVITSGSRGEVERRHPLVRQKWARKPDRRPRMVEAYLYFYDQIAQFFLGLPTDPPIANTEPLSARLEECFQALKSALKVVVVDLEPDDDAQVIFETLNARGEALLPADLLRNYIFLRAARLGEPQEELYQEHWQRFDDHFWRVEVKQGRLFRPRSDLFMQHFLASRLATDISIKHLYIEYKYWIERQHPFENVRAELATVARQGDDFRRIIEPKKGDPLTGLAIFLDAFDIRTAYPLLLTLLDLGIDEHQWHSVTTTVESYLLRRAVCGLTTKNYNRVFLTLTRNLRRGDALPGGLASALQAQTGESVEWPSDDAFREAWRSRHAYHVLNNAKIVYILRRLNDTYLSVKPETVTVEGGMTVEHLMPQGWTANWPLLDGSSGLDYHELGSAEPEDPRLIATRRRHAMVQTIGNLTILTQPLNSALSNSAWSKKKPELLRHSLLPINQQLYDVDVWDEAAIEKRSDELFGRAIKLWPLT